MPLVSRLVALLTEALDPPADGGPPEADDRLAAAALLVHVARVDGTLAAAERRRLVALFMDRFGLSAGDAERLIERAKTHDDATSDVADLVETIATDASRDERRRILRMAYTVAEADGHVHEFEDDLVWRVGRLLGFEDAEILAEKSAAPVRDGVEGDGPS